MRTPHHMFNSTINVERATNTTTKGVNVVTFSSHLANIKCRIHQLSQSEVNEMGAERGIKMWRISCDPLHDIVETDRVIFVDALSKTHTLDIESEHDSSNEGVIKVLYGKEKKP